MENKKLQELMIRVITGRASGEETSELLKMVETSEENKQAFADFKNTNVLAGLRDHYDGMDLEERYKNLKDRIRSSEENAENMLRIETRKILLNLRQIAASIVFIVGISVLISCLFFRSGSSETAYHQLVVPSGQQAQLTLSDGTVIWLNSRSKLRYPGKFARTNRKVLLEGEAYFEVAPNEHKPFIVNSELLGIKVLGTSFNCSAYPDDKTVKITLVNGSVSVTGKHDREIVRLVPGQTAIYTRSDNKMVLTNDETGLYTSWREGQFKFYKMTFGDIARRLSRNFNVTFRIENQEMNNTTFNGSFYNYESLDQILHILQKNYPFHYTITKNEVIIK
jgi:ferric-dicitrate binding protein FerR (iron transport regulator)